MMTRTGTVMAARLSGVNTTAIGASATTAPMRRSGTETIRACGAEALAPGAACMTDDSVAACPLASEQ